MFNIKIKNLIRLIIGFFSLTFHFRKSKKSWLYCNLKQRNITGGPERFLHNLATNKKVNNFIKINNWSLKNCTTSLIFSASWGDSFSRICKYYLIRSVLRVDGFYVPDDSIDDKFQHGLGFRDWVNNRLSRDLRLFDHVIYQSEFSKKICDEYLYQRKKDFSIINNGVNLSHFIPDSNVSNKVLKLVVLGKHYPKHLKLAIDIFIRILNKKNAELLIIGPMRDGSERVLDFISKNVDDKEVLKKIKCKGIVLFDDLPSVLNKSDIFLHVKVGDWCPNAVLEAMACGLPVVCPDWGGTKELVGNAGISVKGPEWDIDESLILGMTDAVLDIQSELSTYKKLARKCATENYCISDVTKKYLKILEL
ncbi:MAG: glycosyltransferase family 4 protein [Desulfobacterales bacterium]|nr:glycosyltransferase family 4 protein [Desulfobacterales bacterium]